MNILITGINGFVGSHLADFLLKDPENRLFGAVKVNARKRNVRHLINHDRVTWIEYDLTDYQSVQRLLEKSKPDRIYHLGALSWVNYSWDMAAAYMQVNAVGTINLFNAVRNLKLDPHILVSCTPEEFGDVKKEDLPITEKTSIAPVNPYAASKVAQDAICQTYHASYGMKIIRTRAFNHEGPRRDISGALASFAYQIALIEQGKQEPVIRVGNLEAKRNFTDVRDMVQAYHLAMERCTPGELYLIGSEQIYTIKECLEMLIGLSAMKDKIRYETEQARVRPTELNYLIGDSSKFTQKTGWKPTISFQKTLQDILDYWRAFVKSDMY
ncbi:MAG: GDP-mannose 4,6-dehydratase [DPANN group archaeon]|nr:GDP-mannose 4,6-dehydratase [DPANN group archaeon]